LVALDGQFWQNEGTEMGVVLVEEFAVVFAMKFKQGMLLYIDHE
jgi:hypothetical protein